MPDPNPIPDALSHLRQLTDPRDAEIARLTALSKRETEQRKAAESVIAAQVKTITALEEQDRRLCAKVKVLDAGLRRIMNDPHAPPAVTARETIEEAAGI